MAIRRVLVTGSSGTIGTRLCERLLQETDCELTALDRRPNAWSEAVQAVTVMTDLCDADALAKLPPDFDAVIHLAANARVYELVLDTAKARDNFVTVYNALEFCRRNGIPRFLFSSSREVYGNAEAITHNEEPLHVKHCESPYAASKVGAEALVQSYHQCYGLEFITFRFSNVYGMYDDSDRVVPLFIRRTTAGEDLTVYGRDKLLDFTYIDDAVDGILLSLERFERARNDVYNIASGEGTTILEVAAQVRKRLQGNNAIHVGENRTGEVVKYVANITKARELLRYQPKVPFHEGIGKAVQWYKANLYR